MSQQCANVSQGQICSDSVSLICLILLLQTSGDADWQPAAVCQQPQTARALPEGPATPGDPGLQGGRGEVGSMGSMYK